ncbi:MAG: adenylate/guanylate cyclase domain-containing protein [bacterium]|nr:adenylate/guanylate cyclase domain-containing protein [bacterium]
MLKSVTKDISKSKIEHLQAKVHIKELQLGALLDITNSINSHFSSTDLLEKYKSFLKEQLQIGKLALYSHHIEWACILNYGFKKSELNKINVDKDLLHIREISSGSIQENKVLAQFDIVIPVYDEEKPLAYLLLADNNNEELSVSRLIKHLNFLQLLTNITVTAIEKERLADELLKHEKERRELMEKQNEILEGIVHERTKELRAEKEESERLLYNILPEELAEELKHKGSTTPMRYDEATVLFTDFKNFTLTSSNVSPKELVNELNEIFQAFDFITEKHSIEKIKTIGDAYMAVCGLPRQSDFHAVQAVRAALDMVRFIEKRKVKKNFSWEMRVGIHSGPLVAGVVGTKKFVYDVWGDTVNIASRMESGGMIGKVNVSQKTFQKIKKYFECDYRGKKEAKGKGKMKMYFVEQEKESERFQKVKRFMIKKLKKELPNDLFYHGLHHTKDVCDVAAGIALKEKISEKEIELIKVAALFHDSGFIKRYEENEIAGNKLAREILPKFKYTREEIRKITRMIIATHTPQRPQNKLEEILADADLDYLGRADFSIIAKSLYEELKANGKLLTEKDWNTMQIGFLKQHNYFTKTSQELRNRGKQKQLEKLIAETST